MLSRRQRADGGIGYWSASDWTSAWLTAYAGAVLLDARDRRHLRRRVGAHALGELSDRATCTPLRRPTSRRRSRAGRISGRCDCAIKSRRPISSVASAVPTLPAEDELLSHGGAAVARGSRAARRSIRAAQADRRGAPTDRAGVVGREDRGASRRRCPTRRGSTSTSRRRCGRSRAFSRRRSRSIRRTRSSVRSSRRSSRRRAPTDAGTRRTTAPRSPRWRRSSARAVARPSARSACRCATARCSTPGTTHDSSVALTNLLSDGRRRPSAARSRSTTAPGDGVVYYYLSVTEVPSKQPVTPENAGIAVERWYESYETGGPITTIAEGELVRVRLRITVPSVRQFVVLDDALPAGLEAIDLSLRTASALARPGHQHGERSRRSRRAG